MSLASRLACALIPLAVLAIGAAVIVVSPGVAGPAFEVATVTGTWLTTEWLYRVHGASVWWVVPVGLSMLVTAAEGFDALQLAVTAPRSPDISYDVRTGAVSLALLAIVLVLAWGNGRRWARGRAGDPGLAREGQRSRARGAVARRVARGERPVAAYRDRRPSPTAALLPLVIVVIGAIMTWAAVATIATGSSRVALLRQHGAAAEATVLGWTVRDITGGAVSVAPPWQLWVAVPGAGRAFETADPPFDGTYATPPPDGPRPRTVSVRYDPADPALVLPESVIRHPSYPRMSRQLAVGATMIALGLAGVAEWARRRARNRSR